MYVAEGGRFRSRLRHLGRGAWRHIELEDVFVDPDWRRRAGFTDCGVAETVFGPSPRKRLTID